MHLSDLQRKDIVNIIDGKKIGKIIDVIIEKETGVIESIVVESSKSIKNLLSGNNETNIKYKEIKKMGEDVILVDITR